MRKNVASQVVGAQLVSATDGSAITSGTVTVSVTGDGGTQGAGGGTVAHEGNGAWSYVPTQAETNYNHVMFTFTHASAIPTTVQAWPVAYNPYDAVRLGLTALPNAAADAAGGLPVSDAGGLDLDTLLARLDAAVSTRATAAALATVDGIVDAILVDTDTTIPGLIAALNDLSAAAVNAEVDTALADYDGPTKAELDAGLAALNDLDAAGVRTAVGLASANLDTQLGDIPTVSEFNARTLVASAYATAAKLLAYAQLLARSDAAIVSDLATDLGEINADEGSGAGDYAPGNDALEALRDRGDAAWTTGAGGSAPTVEDIRAEIDANSTQLAAILTDTGTTLPAQISGLNDLSQAEALTAAAAALSAYDPPTKAELDAALAALNDLDSSAVQSAVNAALVALHLDHLLAVDYDPASKPGVATALLNELVESDGGVSRLTANAVEQTWAAATRSLTALGFTLTASDFGVGIFDASHFDADVGNEFADALLDRSSAVDGLTPRQVLGAVLAGVAGVLSGAATTTITVQNPGGTQTRITATVDADGNRSAITLSFTGL